MEIIQHALGLCGDNHSHLDLMDILIYGGSGVTAAGFYFKSKIKSFWDKLKGNG